ncbi:putative uncharacterized protein [Waddlia chondrophila 2032/99]|uniref:DUF917 domain-containing protein n=2 Tax=Waddlia chondrophila TaxID=71667 RepID=D6YTQ0_WADCW|nr:DUF917 domain-containing protein [Waddlia chondrophila]ADI37511.1 conserved hypothetical protein [Waddlia chondrophila WSU 86-1044]CCB90473.1 putative uncharacterized protein [Waddlia chondrophila 2032/99]
MKKIIEEQLDDLALGAALLGSGGGGDPAYELLMAKQAFEEYGPPDLVDLKEVPDNALVVPIAFMGAPLVSMERLPSGREYAAILKRIESHLGKRATHLVAAEIGGANAFTPLIAGAMARLPVVDADTLGRAFPELQMSSCHLHGVESTPAFLSDPMGNTDVVEIKDAGAMEKCCRKICVEMGSSAAVAVYLMSGEAAKQALIPGTVSQAISLGAGLKRDGLKGICRESRGRVLGTGVVVDIDQSIQEGFLNGMFTLECFDEPIVVQYQNEFLAAFQGDRVLAATPDIIIPVEEESVRPVTSESLQYGLRVDLLCLPSPEVWKTPEGLSLVGPEKFNLRSQKC